MKKIFTLFAAVALGFAAYAQEACPSVLSFAPMAEEQDANKVMIELQLVNSSLNLNGFNMEVGRYAVAEDGTLTADETMQWATDEEDEDWVGILWLWPHYPCKMGRRYRQQARATAL